MENIISELESTLDQLSFRIQIQALKANQQSFESDLALSPVNAVSDLEADVESSASERMEAKMEEEEEEEEDGGGRGRMRVLSREEEKRMCLERLQERVFQVVEEKKNTLALLPPPPPPPPITHWDKVKKRWGIVLSRWF